MPIVATCSCGKTIRVQDQYAGKRVRCPGCQGPLLIPRPEAEPEPPVLEVQAEPPRPPRPARAPVRRRKEEDEEVPEVRRADPEEEDDTALGVQEDEPEQPRGRRKKRSLDDEERLGEIRKKSRRLRREGGDAGRARTGFAANPSVLGGIGMMVLALIWFFGGLAAGIIFFYPPILFILGVAAFIQGLVSNK
jgi:hypothetical protein